MAKKLTSVKAKKILHDKTVHGKPLTEKQRKFFGAIAGGAKPYENGGWLDKFDVPQAQNGIEGTMGGLTDKGFNYNGAWGGPSMQDGGNLIFLEPTSRKLPMGYVIPYNTPSTELATSIGGEGDKPAYLIPSFKYGKLLGDPEAEFHRTGEHLGGPFKTWQEADEWERTVRHPYVEKGQNIPTPLRRWGKDFAMGGNLPGATGSMYARVGAPSNGPYAKKTLASAEDGASMRYYQEGLDFKPKTISKNGGWLDKYEKAQVGKYIPPSTGDIASYYPAIKRMKEQPKIDQTKAEAKKREEQERSRKAIENQPTIGPAKPDYRTDREKAAQRNEMARREAMRNSALAQTMGSFTPSGSRDIGVIGAETFVNMNPVITGPFLSGTRLYGQASGQNPYGFGQSTAGNVMGAIGMLGDAAFLRSAVPSGTASQLGRYITTETPVKNVSQASSSGKLPSPLPPQEPGLSIAPRGNYVGSELIKDKKITWNDIDKVAEKEMKWLQSDEYFKRRSAATGESASEIQKDIDKIVENWKDISVATGKTKKNILGYYSRANNQIVLSKDLSRERGLSTLDHEVKHALSQLGGLKYTKGYKNYPTTDVGNWLTRALDYKNTKYYAEPWEQQVRALRLLDYIDETQGVPRGTKLTMENIDRLAADASPSSVSGQSFWDRYGDVGSQLIKMKDADKQLRFIPSNLQKGKFPFKFKQKENLRQNILDWLNKSYAVPGAVGVGAAALGSDEEVPKQQDGGDIPVDPMGYWNPENWGGPVIIPSTDITMEDVYQPLIGVSDTGDVQYMEPGEDYEFEGDYVTEYPVAKEGVSVNNADAQPVKKLDQLLNFTNYNKPTKGGWLDKYN